MADVGWVAVLLVGVVGIVWGAEAFAEHLAPAAVALGVSTFALALLLAGAEPEELATGIAASLRHAPAVAFGDVVGANIAMCMVAIGVGAIVAPLPFGRRVRLYGVAGLPLGAVAAFLSWGAHITRAGGGLLVGLYVVYVAVIWTIEGQPPALGEASELTEAKEKARTGTRRRVGKDLAIIVAGIAAMSLGATLLVEAVRHLSHTDASQTSLSLTLVGFATAFELVVLAFSASRRGASEAVVAAVVGSYAYNVTMTLGAAALVRPLRIAHAAHLHGPLLVMLGSLVVVIIFGWRSGRISRQAGIVLLVAYPVFLSAVLVWG
ncbi:MAG: sodium:calcium antiporter [Acidimicrobiales bacterium]